MSIHWKQPISAALCLLMLSACWGRRGHEAKDFDQDVTPGNATTSSGGVLVVFNQFEQVATGPFLLYAVVVPTLMRIASISEEQAGEIARKCIRLPDHAALKYLHKAISYVDRLDLYFRDELSGAERMVQVPFRCSVPEAAVRASEACQLLPPRAEYVGGVPGLVIPTLGELDRAAQASLQASGKGSSGAATTYDVAPVIEPERSSGTSILHGGVGSDLVRELGMNELEYSRYRIRNERDQELVNLIDRRLFFDDASGSPNPTLSPSVTPVMRYPAKIRLLTDSERLDRIASERHADRMRTLLTLLQHSRASTPPRTFTPVFLSEDSPIVLGAREIGAPKSTAEASTAPLPGAPSLEDLSVLIPSNGATDAQLNALEQAHYGDSALGAQRRQFMQRVHQIIQQGPTASAAAQADLTTSGPMDPTRFFMLSGDVPRLDYPVYRLSSGEVFTCAFGRLAGARAILQVFRFDGILQADPTDPHVASLYQTFVDRGEDSMNPTSLDAQVNFVNRGYFYGAQSIGLPQFSAEFPGVYFSGVNWIQSIGRHATYSAALIDQYAQLIQSQNSALSPRVMEPME